MFETMMPKKHLFPLYCDATIAIRRSGMKVRVNQKVYRDQVHSDVRFCQEISCTAESSHYMLLLLL